MEHPTLARHQYGEERADAEEWSVAVVGDTVVEESRSPALGDPLQRTIESADLSVANLEGPVVTDARPTSKVGPVNETVPATPTYLRDAGFDAVTLANNHVMDYGDEGLRRTLATCAESGLGTCGAGEDVSAALSPLETAVGDQSVAVLNLCEREFGAATDGDAGTAWIGHPEARTTVERASATNDVVVLVVHGGLEYVPFPPPQYQRRLRTLADAGADVVVGHHPHVPQGWETHDGTPIYYSLGNFRYTRCCRPKTEWGLVLSATFHGADLSSVDLHPVERLGDDVAFMGDRRDPAEYRTYVERAADVTADKDRLRAHWQEQATQVFDQRYSSWLRTATGSDLPSIVRNPLKYVDGRALWDGDDREYESLLLLNLVRNESHRALIETTLGVRTGRYEDQRTPAVRETVRDLVETTEDNPVYDRPSTVRTAVETAWNRLAEKLPVSRAALAPGFADG